MSDENFLEIMKHFDPSGDGVLDYREFVTHFGSGISGSADGADGLSSKLMDADARRAAAATQTTIDFGTDNAAKGRPGEHPVWTAKQVKHAIEDHLALSSKSVLKAFQRFDADHSGALDYDEFRQVIRRYNIEMSDENYLEVMKNFDPDGGGQIEYNEFLSQFGAAIAGGTDGPGGISAKLQHGDETEDRHGKSGGASKPAWGFVTGGGGGDSDDPMGSIGASDGARVGFAPKLPHWRPADVKRVLGQKLGDKYSSTTQAFRYLDEDKSGHLDLHEFRMLMATFNIEMTDEDFSEPLQVLPHRQDGPAVHRLHAPLRGQHQRPGGQRLDPGHDGAQLLLEEALGQLRDPERGRHRAGRLRRPEQPRAVERAVRPLVAAVLRSLRSLRSGGEQYEHEPPAPLLGQWTGTSGAVVEPHRTAPRVGPAPGL